MHRIRQNFNRWFIFGSLPLLLAACSSTKGGETTKEAASAMGVVAGSYTGQPLTEDEIRQKAKEIEGDPEAQSAIKAITEPPKIKYSPVTGKRYSGDLEYDPETGAKLLPLEP